MTLRNLCCTAYLCIIYTALDTWKTQEKDFFLITTKVGSHDHALLANMFGFADLGKTLYMVFTF